MRRMEINPGDELPHYRLGARDVCRRSMYCVQQLGRPSCTKLCRCSAQSDWGLWDALRPELRRLPWRGRQWRSSDVLGQSRVPRNCRRRRDTPHRGKRSAWHAHARLRPECGRNAYGQPDRCSCARNSILGEARCSPRYDCTALCSTVSRRSAPRRRFVSNVLLLMSWT
jgi:hypothetical protein